MAYRTRNSSSFSKKKAQFFVISAVTIVVLLFLVSQWLQPSTVLDASEAVLRDETFIFSNVKEKAIATVKNSKSCDDLSYNLDEYKNFAEQYVAGKGAKLNFVYLISSCSLVPQSTTINFDISLKTVAADISSSFSLNWP